MTMSKWTDDKLESEWRRLEDTDGELSLEDTKLYIAVDHEIDARSEWNSADARIRESVGNYR